MIQEISKEDIELIRKFEDLSVHGYYVNSQQVTDAYNRILRKNVGNTTCGSCIKQRIAELVMVRNRYELELELSKPTEPVEETEQKPKKKTKKKEGE